MNNVLVVVMLLAAGMAARADEIAVPEKTSASPAREPLSEARTYQRLQDANTATQQAIEKKFRRSQAN